MNIRGRAVLILPLLVLAQLSACASPVAPEDADPGLRTSVVPDQTWQRIVRPGFPAGTGFSFSLPPGFTQLDLRPIDSDAATYSRGQATLYYDFGPYTSSASADGTDVI